MKKSRYRVVTCTGWTIGVSSGHANGEPGLTASVLDGMHNAREVKRFRSEDRYKGGGSVPRGRVGAMLAAQDYADALNAGCEPASAS